MINKQILIDEFSNNYKIYEKIKGKNKILLIKNLIK